MKAKKSVPAPPPLVVIPPRREDPAHTSLLLPPGQQKKHPLAAREHPHARNATGKATRAEIRQEAPRTSAPRNTSRPAERGGQPRSHKAGK